MATTCEDSVVLEAYDTSRGVSVAGEALATGCSPFPISTQSIADAL